MRTTPASKKTDLEPIAGAIPQMGETHNASTDLEAGSKYDVSVPSAPPILDRGRLCNDILNTAVMAALVGGFALSSLQMDYYSDEDEDGEPDNKLLDTLVFMTTMIACHACTCSALASAFLYRWANGLSDADVTKWAENNKLLLQVPMMKFGMGCVSYLLSVVFLSWKILQPVPIMQVMGLVIGAMSISMVFMTYAYIQRTSPNVNYNLHAD